MRNRRRVRRLQGVQAIRECVIEASPIARKPNDVRSDVDGCAAPDFPDGTADEEGLCETDAWGRVVALLYTAATDLGDFVGWRNEARVDVCLGALFLPSVREQLLQTVVGNVDGIMCYIVASRGIACNILPTSLFSSYIWSVNGTTDIWRSSSNEGAVLTPLVQKIERCEEIDCRNYVAVAVEIGRALTGTVVDFVIGVPAIVVVASLLHDERSEGFHTVRGELFAR